MTPPKSPTLAELDERVCVALDNEAPPYVHDRVVFLCTSLIRETREGTLLELRVLFLREAERAANGLIMNGWLNAAERVRDRQPESQRDVSALLLPQPEGTREET